VSSASEQESGVRCRGPRAIAEAMLRRVSRSTALGRVVRNALVLFTGDVGASLVGLAAFALTARSLKAELFGVLVLIRAYALSVDCLLNFQSWHALISFGARALENDRRDDFMRLVKYCTVLDAATAIVGTVVAVTGALLLGAWVGWEARVVRMAAVYSVVILFNLSGAPTAVLRLFDRFWVFGAAKTIGSIAWLCGSAAAFLCGAGLWGYLLAWMSGHIVRHVVLLGAAWYELWRRGMGEALTRPMRGLTDRYDGLWRFVVVTNLNTSLRTVSRLLDTLAVGAILGPAAAGLYKVAKEFASVPGRFVTPFYHAIYPELSKLLSSGRAREFRQLVLRSAALAGASAAVLCVLFALLAGVILEYTVGEGFLGARSVLIWYMLGMAIAIGGFPLQPAMLAWGRPGRTLVAHLVSTIAYFAALCILLQHVGLVGAGQAFVAHYAVWTALMVVFERRLLFAKTPQIAGQGRG